MINVVRWALWGFYKQQNAENIHIFLCINVVYLIILEMSTCRLKKKENESDALIKWQQAVLEIIIVFLQE